MPIVDDLRAAAMSFPAVEIRASDFMTLAGSCLRVTAAAHRGGTTWLELDRNVRLHLPSDRDVTVIRPVRPARRARPARPVRASWVR
ncbi:hypothetical protein [Streptomyces lonarensis]|uniref:Uncharacterized protein n=1 Tax=Streptomyces lonarensis TaxID=700599 RepID=A0A7X6HZ48_9ACTN|nr:hypothetical protein [Streptomyces lonarensis]NJQ06090.1 hypothetical protein [Streptomyces lonarensis]